jgi:hypothetical protein
MHFLKVLGRTKFIILQNNKLGSCEGFSETLMFADISSDYLNLIMEPSAK